MVDEYLIRRRDKGEKVRTLQQGLIRLGYDLGPLGADGDFGSKTEAAVRLFQSDKGLPVDAVWDSDCQAEFEEALKAKASDQIELPHVTLDRLIDVMLAHRASLDHVLEELMDVRELNA